MPEAKAKDQGHKHKCSQKKGLYKFFSGSLKKKKIFKKILLAKKEVFKNIFLAISKKTVKKNIFQPIYKILTIQKIVLSSSRGHGNLRGLEGSCIIF